MATKTLTIMGDVYDLLVKNKMETESFSDELRRILSKKKARPLMDFFGILSDKEGEDMLKDLEKIKSANVDLLKKSLR
ncbi:antitoxin VapB family protein [Candidatus Woesearchaeota archaeon]|nr:antitoxin VapB family protein [Candidatus Woesearchaeota archaeon]